MMHLKSISRYGGICRVLLLIVVITMVLIPLVSPVAAEDDPDGGTPRQQADKVLKGNLGTFGQKVSRLADIVMVVGAMGALLGFALIGARMTMGGWSVENLNQCKSGVLVIMLGVLLALSSKILAGVVYQAVR